MNGLKHNKYYLRLAGIFCLSIVLLSANGQSLSTSIDRKDILIGEPITYKIRMDLPSPNDRVEFLLPDSLEHFEILQRVALDTTVRKDHYSELKIKFTSWDSGKWYLPAIPLQVSLGGSAKKGFLKTDPIEINVGHMPIDSTGLPRDIKSNIKVSLVSFNWWYLIPALILALQLFIIIRGLLSKDKKAKPVFDASESPYKEAVNALNKLNPAGLNHPQEVKKYYSALADIFKRFLSRTENKNYLPRTTGEVLMALKDRKESDGTVSTASEVLRKADAVKFAKYMPGTTESVESKEKLINAITNITNQKTG